MVPGNHQATEIAPPLASAARYTRSAAVSATAPGVARAVGWGLTVEEGRGRAGETLPAGMSWVDGPGASCMHGLHPWRESERGREAGIIGRSAREVNLGS